MSDESRTYTMRRRAEAQLETRRRITESAVALHGTLGPARTTIGAIAEHAGVRRSTVYRHFADEAALFEACSTHWSRANPPPDIGAWASEPDPARRLRAALGELYPYYRRTAPMLDNVYRDGALMPVVAEILGDFDSYLAAGADALMAGRGLRGAARRRTRAALGHAVAFSTWRSLAREQGLGDGEAAALAAALVDAAATRAVPRRPA